MGALLAGFQSYAQCPKVWFFDTEHQDHFVFDTNVDCANPEIILHSGAFVPVQRFNGTYEVKEIPYNPADPTFHAGTHRPQFAQSGMDDKFDNEYIPIDFPFCFFGQVKTRATLGANGMVTFTDGAPNQDCPWSYSAGLPFTATTNGAPSPRTYMMDAIFGVYEDTDPTQSGTLNTAPNYTGIFKSVSPESDWPCRHVTLSWNNMAHFGQENLKETYQIVFYEGTNVIEIHVKDRNADNTWNNSNGIIGIQNATGQTQEWGTNYGPNDYRYWIQPNSPGYFVPSNLGNPFTGSIHNRAWRFTPMGSTRQNKSWWSITAPNNDTITLAGNLRVHINDLTSDQLDIIPDSLWTRIQHSSEYADDGIDNPTAYLPDINPSQGSEADSLLHVAPKEPTIYKCKAVFVGATGYQYVLNAYCRVDVDTANTTAIECPALSICHGTNVSADLTFPTDQNLASAVWTMQNIVDGDTIDLPTNRYSVLNRTHMTLTPTPADQLIPNHIDTVIMSVMPTYTNGCRNNTSITILTYPNFDVHVNDTMCENDQYEFNGSTYTMAGNYPHNLTSTPGCDSIVTLHLETLGITYFDDVHRTCEPYTWPNNNQTYASSTSTPQVTLVNKFGCDSVVTLKLEVIPVHAAISLSPTGATLDNLVIRLTDISTGDDTREWQEMPNGATSDSYIYNYTFPAEADSITIRLRAISNLGCEDTAYVTIPMLKEAIWLPNIFSPLADAPNNVFRPIGIGITEMEMWIYNRQGQLIHHAEGLDSYWDGTTDSGLECPQGAYVYRIRYANVLNPEAKQIKFGSVTLLK